MTIATRTRRTTTGIALAASFLLVAAGCSSAGTDPTTDPTNPEEPQLSGEIIWADFGGPTNEARQEFYFDSFYDETGVDVVSTMNEDAIYMAMLRGEPGDYDIFQASSAEVLPATANLLELPADAQGELLPAALRPYYIGGFVFGTAQGWLTETFPNGGPENWVDFFDVDKFPGKRAWPGAPGSFDASYEIALLGDGVPLDDLYPIDFERAEAKLDSIREDMIFYQSYPEVQQLLTSKSAAIAVTVTGQYTALMNAGQDVTIQWNEAFSVPSGLVAPADVRNPNEVVALARWINDPERQAEFTARTGYGPVNPDVFDYLSPEVSAEVVNSPAHDGLIAWDDQWRADNYGELLDRYTAWLAG